MQTTQNPEVAKIEALAHTKVADCYQCGKCSAGCPMGDEMDIIPSSLLRMVQNGEVEEAMQSEAIWKCVSCLTCSTRCPKSVHIAGILDALKQRAIEENKIAPSQRRTVLFQQVFLDNIRRNGRLNEIELVGTFKTLGFFQDWSVGNLLKDSMLGPKMMGKGKLHLKVGSPVKDKAVVKRIFKKCKTAS
jgi:heterodisulfide reductase subunit C